MENDTLLLSDWRFGNRPFDLINFLKKKRNLLLLGSWIFIVHIKHRISNFQKNLTNFEKCTYVT